MSGRASYVYVGLAGETGPGHEIRSGLYRSRGGESPWERVGQGLPPSPHVRAIAVHPEQPSRVTIGVQDGLYRSDDHGEHWARLNAPAPGLAVWSLAFHPHDPDIMLAGYEPSAILRTTDGGTSWKRLPVDVTFPDVTQRPHPQPKRVTGLTIDPTHPAEIYASVEVGGLLRSLDDGARWECVTEGLYANDDPVDLHGVMVSPAHPRLVNVIGRIGMFRSPDRGAHWRHVALPPLTPRGTYCRVLRAAPDDPDTLYVAAGTDFAGDKGALLESRDNGGSWRRLDLGATPRSTLFAFAIDAREPERLHCASSGGEVFSSPDRGASWRTNPLPEGASQVYALAVG